MGLITSGAISAWAGRLVTDHLTGLDRADADRVVAEISQRVHQRISTGRRPYHSAEVNRLARAARLRLCPEPAQESRRRAFRDRRVLVHPRNDGMATLIADLADVDAHRIHRRLTAIAAGLQADAASEGAPEERTRDQLRADILVDLLIDPAGHVQPAHDQAAHGHDSLDQAAHGHDSTGHDSHSQDGARDAGPGHPASQVQVQVVVTLPTLLGLADDPAHVPGLGPVPADVARALACDGRWRAWIVDARGAVTATGSTGYTPSAGVARLVRAREPRCRFPGCHQPAIRCDLDHAIPWPRGRTAPDNLGPLCRRHYADLRVMPMWSLGVACRGASAALRSA